MKVCIAGAGAIGSLLGARLAAAGNADVGVLARGDTLAGLREHGWRLHTQEGLIQLPARASDDMAELGVPDVLLIATKGPALSGMVKGLAPFIGPQTWILPAMNGVPWWFAQVLPALAGLSFDTVDPDGIIARHLPVERVIGTVVHASASVISPGQVRHNMGNGLVIGHPSGQLSHPLERIAELLTSAGFAVRQSENVCRDIWYKLWGNLTMNPVSALTGATGDLILADPLVRTFCSSAMEEAARIGRRLGLEIDETPEQRHSVTERLGAFKTSMLQDVEAGRALELDNIVTIVSQIGRHLGIATPNIDAIVGLTRLFGRVHGLYH